MLDDSFKDCQFTEPLHHDRLKASCNAEAVLLAHLCAFRSTLCCAAQVVESLRHEINPEVVFHFLEDSHQMNHAAAEEERWEKRNQPREEPYLFVN